MTEMTRAMALAAGLVLACGIQQAGAQGAPPESRLVVSVNGGYQARSQDVAVHGTFTEYDEEGTIDATQTIKGGGLFDIGAAYRVWRNLSVGIAVTRVGSTAGAAVTVEVPHPLFAGEPRTASGTAGGLKHREIGTHIQVMWVLPLTRGIDLTLSGGPSVFSVKQDLATGVTVTEVGPPYTAVNLADVTTSSASKTAAGFNVGADAAYMITPRLGAGFFLRYAAASADFPVPGGGRVSVDAGGLQVGAGVRVHF